MDPVSILTTVVAVSRTALALSSTLYTLVQATKGVDGTVRALYDEVTGLNFTLDALSATIKAIDIGKTRNNEQSLKLWSTVTRALAGCREAVNQLHKALEGFQKEGSNAASQAIRALKLHWKSDQINTLRSHLHSHNTSLQLGLQIINLHFTSIGPQLVIDDLVPRIEMLMDMVLKYSEMNPITTCSVPTTGVTPNSASIISNAENLVASAKEVLLEARSVVANSERGSVYASSTASVIQRLEDLEHDFDDDMTAIRGKVPLRSANSTDSDPHSRIRSWIPTVRPQTGFYATDFSETDSISGLTQMTPSGSTFNSAREGPETALFDYDDSDGDDEVDYMVLEACLKRSFDAYKNGDWAGAELLLQRIIDDSTPLPTDKLLHIGIDTTLLKFRMAICALQQDKMEEAGTRLLELITTKSPPDEKESVAMRRIVLIYLFAELCFSKKKPEEARRHCRTALKMKRKLLGDDFPFLEHNAFNLLSVVARTQGDVIAAEVFLEKAKEASLVKIKKEDSGQKLDLELQMAQLEKVMHFNSHESDPPSNASAAISPIGFSLRIAPAISDIDSSLRTVKVFNTRSEWSKWYKKFSAASMNSCYVVFCPYEMLKGFEYTSFVEKFQLTCSSDFPNTPFVHCQFAYERDGIHPMLGLVKPKDDVYLFYLQFRNGKWHGDSDPIDQLKAAMKKHRFT